MVVPNIVSAGATEVTVYWDGVPSEPSSLSVLVDGMPWLGNKIGLISAG